MMLLSLAACSKQAPQHDPVSPEPTRFTGVLEEKKDFMLIVESMDGKDSYIFNLPESGLNISADEGDTITVTYTGDINDIDAQLKIVDINVEK